jgi:NAD(P)H dehydrogenase (quinone)
MPLSRAGGRPQAVHGRLDEAIKSGKKLRVLIVHAHHEPTSFNGALTREAVRTLEEAGHEVIVSDLYAMGFDPISDRRNFLSIANAERFSQQTEEAYASAHGTYAPDLQSEMDKLVWCDLLILQFPMWWLGLPAILKGWIDRVFALGRAYGGGRWFDRGWLAGKWAMCSMTVGGPAEQYSEVGFYMSAEEILLPVHRGILGFTGFTVIEPFIVYGLGRISPKDRSAYLASYRQRLLGLGDARTIDNPWSEDYEGFILKSAARKST